MATFGSILSNSGAPSFDQIRLYAGAPTTSSGGAAGIGSNLVSDSNAVLDMDPRYYNAASISSAYRHVFAGNVASGKGSAGARIIGTGTISSSGTNVTGSSSNFAAGDVGEKINATAISGGVISYYTATIASFSAATGANCITLTAPGFVDYNGTTSNVPAGSSYSVNPDRTDSDQLTTFQGPYYGSHAIGLNLNWQHNGFGVHSPLTIYTNVNDFGTAGKNFGEVSALSNHVSVHRKGVFAGSEWGISVDAGKQARAYSLGIVHTDLNPYTDYANAVSGFGASSNWTGSGSRALMLQANHTVRSGTGIEMTMRAGGGWQRAFVLNDAATAYNVPGSDLVTFDGWGNLGFYPIVCNQTNHLTGFPAKITLPGTNNVPADGIRFGAATDGNFVNLYRSADNRLRTDDSMTIGLDCVVGAQITLTSSTSLGFIHLPDQTSTVGASSGDALRLFGQGAASTADSKLQVRFSTGSAVTVVKQGATNPAFTLGTFTPDHDFSTAGITAGGETAAVLASLITDLQAFGILT